MVGLSVPAMGSALAEVGHFGLQPVAIAATGEWRQTLEDWANDERRYLAHIHSQPWMVGPPDREIGDHWVVPHIANKTFTTMQEVVGILRMFVRSAWKVRVIQSKEQFISLSL